MIKFFFFIVVYALSMAGANLLMKVASQMEGPRWWIYFGLANLAGFGMVLVLPFALKLANPNLVYALTIGVGFTLLQLSACFFFREALSPWQWGGIGLITLGIIFLQIRG